jgi:ABC-type multidrug transport system fused ATPase/permease subunit
MASDLARASALPEEEGRAGVFEGLHRVAELLVETLPNLAANAFAAAILSVAVALAAPPRVSLIAVCALLIGGGALLLSRGWIGRAQDDAWVAWGHVVEGVADAFDGRLDLVAAGRDVDFLERFGLAAASWGRNVRRAGRVAALSGRLPYLALGLVLAATIAIDAKLRGESWGHTIAAAGLLASNAPAFAGIAHGVQDVLRGERRLHLLSRILGMVPGPRGGTAEIARLPSRIEWQTVRFAYDKGAGGGAHEVLHGVSFEWRRGEILALNGPNGSGKTTCVRMLLALGEPTGGAVFVDGIPVTKLDPRRWRSKVAFLPQRPYLAHRSTIRECLHFLDPELTEDVMLAAVDRVGLLPMLRRMGGDPLAHRVGYLSVGQRQRLAIARVLSRNAPLLVLDEPDANLDRGGIQLVAELIAELAQDRMVLVVAHSPETLMIADRVVMIDGGLVRSDVQRRATIPSAAGGT